MDARKCQLQLPDCQGNETLHGLVVATATIKDHRSYLVCKDCCSTIVRNKLHRDTRCTHDSHSHQDWVIELLSEV